MKEAIARDRGIDPSVIDDVANNIGIRVAEDMVDLKLADALLYEDELEALLEKKLGDSELSEISFMEYTLPERMFNIDLEDPEAIAALFEEPSELSKLRIISVVTLEIFMLWEAFNQEKVMPLLLDQKLLLAIKEARLAPDVKAVLE